MTQRILKALLLALSLLPACSGNPGASSGEPAGRALEVAGDEPAPVDEPSPGQRTVAGAQAKQCRAPIDCQPQARCRTVDYVPTLQCGACSDLYPDECKTDADCPAQHRCRQIGPCGCGTRQYKCDPGGCKADAECKTGWTCDADGHCGPAPCETDRDCPAHFACGTSRCSRRACTADAECKDGFCVNRMCYPDLGTCYMPSPSPPSAAPSPSRPVVP